MFHDIQLRGILLAEGAAVVNACHPEQAFFAQ
jgi:hypothetical protein